jgi:KaiC/GvpD/RAD55 family RecA-like ATPase
MSQAQATSTAPIVCGFAAADIAEEWQQLSPQPIPSGMPELDHALAGGFLPESLAVVCAGTGRGKTGLVIQFARGWLAQGRPVLFIETEMSKRQILARFLGQLMVRPWREVFEMGPSAVPQLAALAQEQLPLLCVVRWQRSQRVGQIIASFPAQSSGAPQVIVDQISDLARAEGTQDMRFATARVTGELKALAEQHRTLILAVSQTARYVTAEQDRRGVPRRSGRGFEGAAKDAGEVETDAATLLYLESEPVKRNGLAKAQLHISKSRGGPSDAVLDLLFNGAIGTFQAAETSELARHEKEMLAAIRELGEHVGIGKLRARLRIGQAVAETRLKSLADAGLIVRGPRGICLVKKEGEPCP